MEAERGLAGLYPGSYSPCDSRIATVGGLLSKFSSSRRSCGTGLHRWNGLVDHGVWWGNGGRRRAESSDTVARVYVDSRRTIARSIATWGLLPKSWPRHLRGFDRATSFPRKRFSLGRDEQITDGSSHHPLYPEEISSQAQLAQASARRKIVRANSI
jgi:hypothetical protein